MNLKHPNCLALIVVLGLFAGCGASPSITSSTKTQHDSGKNHSLTGNDKVAVVSEAQIRDAMQAYIDRFNAKDGEGLAALFADNAKIEDPVGGGKIVEGRVAIDEFYRGAVEVVDRLELVAPIRSSYGTSGAMAFDIYMHYDGRSTVISAIDVMTFDQAGKSST